MTTPRDPILLALRAVTMSLEAIRLEIRAHAAATGGNHTGPFATPAEQAAVRLQERADKLARQVMDETDAYDDVR